MEYYQFVLRISCSLTVKKKKSSADLYFILQHFICQVDDFDIPQVTLTFSEAGLQALTAQCQIYASRMQQIARQNAISRYFISSVELTFAIMC